MLLLAQRPAMEPAVTVASSLVSACLVGGTECVLLLLMSCVVSCRVLSWNVVPLDKVPEGLGANSGVRRHPELSSHLSGQSTAPYLMFSTITVMLRDGSIVAEMSCGAEVVKKVTA